MCIRDRISSKGQELLIEALPAIKANLNHFFEDEIEENEAFELCEKIQSIKANLKTDKKCAA